MPNSPQSFPTSLGCKEVVCIDCNRVLDSCRDKDCFEDVRVFLTDYGQEIIEKTCAVRAKSASILWAYIDIDPVPFNRGFYQLSIKIYVKVTCEACVGPGNIQTFDGLGVVEKRLILFGSEGNVNIYRSKKDARLFARLPRDAAAPERQIFQSQSLKRSIR